MTKNGLFDQLNDEDKAKVRSWAERAKNPRYETDIPPELFIGAKLGVYYGWEARVAFGRGYILGVDDDGKFIKIPYTFEDAVADVLSAEKIYYNNMIANGDVIASANLSAKSPQMAKHMVDTANQIRKGSLNG